MGKSQEILTDTVKTKRFFEIDFFRGIAVIAMIVFHAFYLLNFLGVSQFKLGSIWFLILARFAAITFLILVGVSMSLTYQKNKLNQKPEGAFYKKQMKHGLIVLAGGVAISIVTRIMIPDQWVVWGVLHLIGMSILLLSPLAKYRIWPLILALLTFLINFWLKSQSTGQILPAIFGLKVAPGNLVFNSIDFFPFLPWIGYIIFGISLGNVLYRGFQRHFPIPEAIVEKSCVFFEISWIGKKSLLIYLLHIPVLFLVIKFFGNLNFR